MGGLPPEHQIRDPPLQGFAPCLSEDHRGEPMSNMLSFAYLLKTQLFNFLGNMGYLSVKY